MFALFLLPGITQAETEVCGTLKLAQEWTAAESPYRITGDVFVPATSRLRIGPGVEVVFAAHPKACAEKDSASKSKRRPGALVGMTLEGAFYCVGEPKKPVIFRPESQGTVGWEGLHLIGQAQDAAEIAFAEFRGANRAVQAEQAEFIVHHALFEDNNVGLWMGRRADLIVLHCDFIGNRSAGLRLEKASPKIANNIFHRNRAYGIWIGEGGGFSIAYNAFYGNGEEDCFHCPYPILKPAGKNANGDTADASFNVRADPVFEGSEGYKAMQAADPSLDTPPHLVKDTKVADMEKKSRLLFWKKPSQDHGPFTRRGSGPYVLSKYSKLIHAGHPAKALRNPDHTTADIGLHGGPQIRITGNPF